MAENDSGSVVGAIVSLILLFLPLAIMFYKINQVKRLRKEMLDAQFVAKASEAELREEAAAMRKRFCDERERACRIEEKYSPIGDIQAYVLDMEAKARDILAAAEKQERESQGFCSKVVSDAKKRYSEIKQQAVDTLSAAKEESNKMLDSSQGESNKIIAVANERANSIAGAALEAKDKAADYKAAIIAMRNTIHGYKDEYIVPNQSVLDSLAVEYNFSDAGKNLKQSRSRVRLMVRNDQAGNSGYLDAVKKKYAVHFVVDAFNGKVDTALAKVKHDNFGKIRQEVIDAYALVNYNGEAFSRARITQAYLDARLDELNWAVATHELRRLEKEEQREISQRIREEEKAIRDAEKAIKLAVKEERILQAAMGEVRAELAKASNEQRQMYENKLAVLEVKLAEAESLEKRALSMAQQTRSGHVYIISNIGSFGEGVYKVGMTRRLEPMDRVKELGDASVPFQFDVHAMIYSHDAPKLEKALHRSLKNEAVNKINPRKEFFRTGINELKALVEGEGIEDIHWTLKSEAAEFRESLAVGKKQQEVFCEV